MLDLLFEQQSTWLIQGSLEPLKTLAKQAGFSESSFEACLKNQQVLDGIDWVRQRGAEKFGVNSTPTFFINGTIHRGEMTLEETEKLLQPYLKS